jgi:hypothetical protein
MSSVMSNHNNNEDIRKELGLIDISAVIKVYE